MVERLGAAVPDLGKDTAGDSTALHARRKGEKAAKAEIADGLPQPSGGKKEYLDDEGKVTKIVEWFGYKLHLLVDAKHEVVLAYKVTTANAADCKSLPDLSEQGQANLPEDRIETLAYDKAADDNESHLLRQDRARGPRHRSAAVPADSASHQEVRAVVRRTHVGGAGERPVETFLGRR
jgi:hypothetical protein